MFRLIDVTPLWGYRLRLQYADGIEGEVDFSGLVGEGVFRLWNDASAFQAVSIGSSGEIRWSDEVDLCADALYLEITDNSPEDVFPNLRKADGHVRIRPDYV
jgi:hypothetical protein